MKIDLEFEEYIKINYGLKLKEFISLRNEGSLNPKSSSKAGKHEMTLDNTNIAQTIAAKAMLFQCLEDPAIEGLLQTQTEVATGIWLAKVFDFRPNF